MFGICAIRKAPVDLWTTFAVPFIEPLKAAVVRRPASTGANDEYTSQRCRRHSESRHLGSRGHRSHVPQRLSAETANGEASRLFLPLPSRPAGRLVIADGRDDPRVFGTGRCFYYEAWHSGGLV